jgi:hypothetical protein
MRDRPKTEFTREELYERVWTEPMVKLAETFGLSDRGLAKLCERNSIPVPPRGYWAQKASGKRVNRPPLLKLQGNTQSLKIEISPYLPTVRARAAAGQQSTNIYKELFDRELSEAPKLELPVTLRNPHKLVASWIQDQQANRMRWPSLAKVSAEDASLEKRRLRIISALLTALEFRGFVVDQDRSNPKQLSARFGQDHVKFELAEQIRQRRRKLTDEEKREGRTEQEWTQTRERTGVLVLRIWSMPAGVTSEWRDEQDTALEQQLHVAVVGFIVAAAYEAERRKIREEEEAKRRQAAEQAQQQEEMRLAGLARKRALADRAAAWAQACQIKSYVAEVQRAAELGLLREAKEDIDHWVEWALAQANELDPIASGKALSLVPIKVEPDREPRLASGIHEDYRSSGSYNYFATRHWWQK